MTTNRFRDVEVRRRSIELYRWRCYWWIFSKERRFLAWAIIRSVLSEISVSFISYFRYVYSLSEVYFAHTTLQQFEEFLESPDTRGILLSRDGAPGRLFSDRSAQTTEIVGTVLKAVSPTGKTQQLAPMISRPTAKTSYGLLAAIGWGDIRNNYLRRLTSSNSWKFLHFVCDSAAVNYKMIRCIVSDTMQFPRLMVSFSPCYDHVLSLVDKWE